jgi:DnaJ-class molecular chaperone
MSNNTSTVMMPRELTAENGAKRLLIGEFKERVPVICPHCFGGGDSENESEPCKTCEGDGEVYQEVVISWGNIKAIYAKCVEGLINEQ